MHSIYRNTESLKPTDGMITQ